MPTKKATAKPKTKPNPKKSTKVEKPSTLVEDVLTNVTFRTSWSRDSKVPRFMAEVKTGEISMVVEHSYPDFWKGSPLLYTLRPSSCYNVPDVMSLMANKVSREEAVTILERASKVRLRKE